MGIVRAALQFQLAHGTNSPNEIIPRPSAETRAFWQDMGVNIGAVNGQPTSLIYVEYSKQGGVHGYPINRQQLQRKGATI